jgi:hypothetical protein
MVAFSRAARGDPVKPAGATIAGERLSLFKAGTDNRGSKRRAHMGVSDLLASLLKERWGRADARPLLVDIGPAVAGTESN